MNNADRPINPTIDILKAGEVSHTQNKEQGLTKREYFTGLAMQGMLSSVVYYEMDLDTMALESVEMADRVLKQLEE